MTRTALIAALLLALGACSDSRTATKALLQAGYTNIHLTGYSLWGCGDRDDFSTGFEATSPAGIPITGVVCSGWFKGATIRTF